MISKKTLLNASLIATLAVSAVPANAQDIHFTQFEAAPLVINPAFTGGFNGQFRAAAIYRNQWSSITNGFVTYGASFDAPVVRDLSHDDYLAVGVQLYNDRAGDANLSNLSGLASVAYHKFFGGGVGKEPGGSLSIGFQAGYTQKSFDLSKLYFADQYGGGGFPGPGTEVNNLTNKVDYLTVNAGISYSQALGDRFGFTIGAGANNLNQPKESFRRQSNSEVGLGMRYTGQLGMIIFTSDKFSLRPGVLYQTQSTSSELLAGNEFNLIVGDPEFRATATSVFVGGYYRTGDAMIITAGMEYKGFRFGISYDYNNSTLKNVSKGNGGFEISLRYIAPNPFDYARRLSYPCTRF